MVAVVPVQSTLTFLPVFVARNQAVGEWGGGGKNSCLPEGERFPVINTAWPGAVHVRQREIEIPP